MVWRKIQSILQSLVVPFLPRMITWKCGRVVQDESGALHFRTILVLK